jgi:hypothetical protein
VMFSAEDLAKQFFERKTIGQFDAELPEFAELLKTQFREYLAARTFEKWPATRLIGQDPILFNVTFFYSHPQAGIKIKRVVFRYVKQRLPLIDVSIEDSSEKRIIGDGAEPILRELLQGNNPNFDQERRDLKIRTVLFDKAWAREITLKEAFDFARAIIKSTSEKGKLLQGMLGSISPSYDCAVLTKKGFKWYVKNAKVDH